MIETYATLGPACCRQEVLEQMLTLGLTGFRLNLSHRSLAECRPWTQALQQAAAATGTAPQLIIDLRGGEIRLPALPAPIPLQPGEELLLGRDGIPLEPDVLQALQPGQTILVDDGIMELTVLRRQADQVFCRCQRGGMVEGRKSLTLPSLELVRPALSEEDEADLACAREHGVTAVMQPFVRSRKDLLELRQALERHGLTELRIFAKVEDAQGVETLPEWMELCDVVTIARGDLGSNLPLFQLPRAQKKMAAQCRAAGKDFLVVTHLLQSMIHASQPTRAEVCDVYNACLDGAAALMLTGETAQGAYPVEAVKVLLELAHWGELDRQA